LHIIVKFDANACTTATMSYEWDTTKASRETSKIHRSNALSCPMNWRQLNMQ